MNCLILMDERRWTFKNGMFTLSSKCALDAQAKTPGRAEMTPSSHPTPLLFSSDLQHRPASIIPSVDSGGAIIAVGLLSENASQYHLPGGNGQEFVLPLVLSISVLLVSLGLSIQGQSNDPEFDDLERKYKSIEAGCERLYKDARVFRDGVLSLLLSGDQFSVSFTSLFSPLGSEYDLIGKFPQAENTIKHATQYSSLMSELRTVLSPELELIDARIIGPCKELNDVLKRIRKTISKREHKLVDYDRHNNSLTKLRDKKEKSMSDEKNLFKYEQDFELATEEYDHYNNALKIELPQFLRLSTRFIDPLFHSFYFMQLNIFYMMLEKLQSFADGKYDLSRTDMDNIYDEAIGDTAEVLEGLSVVQRQTSTAKMMSQHGHTGLGRKSSSSSSTLGRTAGSVAAPPLRSSSSYSSAPPPSRTVAAPPAYTAPPSSSAYSGAGGVKKAPPPPPPLKPKPSYNAPAPAYVVALFDFEAQAAGDLGFSVGDRIELIERTPSTEDWWTGRLDGREGVFPGNYVQEA
ncbi:Amphiphysin [Phaffia rhodozyma]|uniref:Amphiphysin n=1 Tax=Phaffia rhodozyma TaxID=264483 RepID=A0A0F7SMS8_PHARH|nr:Amphiphysin [Phaffia rhodozyma]